MQRRVNGQTDGRTKNVPTMSARGMPALCVQSTSPRDKRSDQIVAIIVVVVVAIVTIVKLLNVRGDTHRGCQAMEKRFVVKSSTVKGGFVTTLAGPSVIVGILLALVATNLQSQQQQQQQSSTQTVGTEWPWWVFGDEQISTLRAMTILVLIISVWLTVRSSKSSPKEATVTMSNLGIRIGNGRTNGGVDVPFQRVLDVVVNEIILTHKVVSVVIIRVFKPQQTNGREQGQDPMESVAMEFQSSNNPIPADKIQQYMMEGRIELVEAFPGVELSFQKCHAIRREMEKALLSLRGTSH